jgi:hypothetical protein
MKTTQMDTSSLRSQPSSRWRRWSAADSGLWLVAVAAAYSLAQVLFVPPRLGLGWDETIYVSQVAAKVPASSFSAPRARGISLLVAPIASLTTSTAALRIYLSILSGLGLLAALWAWRRLRPAWQLALAGALLCGLWVTQFYGPQAMPNLWVAFGGLAAAGFFLQVTRQQGHDPAAGRPIAPLAGLAASLAVAALVRPSDAIWLALPMIIAAALVRNWPRLRLLAAIAGGLAAGSAEWVAEAYVRFGGLAARLHQSSLAEGTFGLHFALPAELRALNGPTLCKPCTVAWKYPVLSLWWFALPVLAALGVLAAARAGRLASSLIPALCGLSAALPYLFLINYAAPRFLLPTYALLAIPVSDGLGWMISAARADLRPVVLTVAAFCLVGQLTAEHLVLDRAVARTMVDHTAYTRVVAGLRAIGVRPPCLLTGNQAIPIAFYARCTSAQISGTDKSSTPAGIVKLAAMEPTAVLESPGTAPPGYARAWQRHPLPGTRQLRLVAYLAPR